MEKAINIIEIVISILLMLAVLVQNKGTGLSETFGGQGAVYQTKRGAEKFIFYATIILGILFAGLAFANLLI